MTETAVAPALRTVLPAQARVTAYDGSIASPADAEVTLHVRDRGR